MYVPLVPLYVGWKLIKNNFGVNSKIIRRSQEHSLSSLPLSVSKTRVFVHREPERRVMAPKGGLQEKCTRAAGGGLPRLYPV